MTDSTVFVHKIDPTASGVNLVQSAAKDFSGECTRKFSQCTDPVSRIINMLPSTSDGICLMLAASWIGNLANGKSLWDTVYFGGKFNVADKWVGIIDSLDLRQAALILSIAINNRHRTKLGSLGYRYGDLLHPRPFIV